MTNSEIITLKLQLKYLADAASTIGLALGEEINAFTETEIDTALAYNLGKMEAHLVNVTTILYPYLNKKEKERL